MTPTPDLPEREQRDLEWLRRFVAAIRETEEKQQWPE